MSQYKTISTQLVKSLEQYVQKRSNYNRRLMLGYLAKFCQYLARKYLRYVKADYLDKKELVDELAHDFFLESIRILESSQPAPDGSQSNQKPLLIRFMLEGKSYTEIVPYLKRSLLNWLICSSPQKLELKNLTASIKKRLLRLRDEGILESIDEKRFKIVNGFDPSSPQPDLKRVLRDCLSLLPEFCVKCPASSASTAIEKHKPRKKFQKMYELIKLLVTNPATRGIIWTSQVLSELLEPLCNIEKITLISQNAADSEDDYDLIEQTVQSTEASSEEKILVEAWINETFSQLVSVSKSKKVIQAGLLYLANKQYEFMKIWGLRMDWLEIMNPKNSLQPQRIAERIGKILGCSIGTADGLLKKFRKKISENLSDLPANNYSAFELLIGLLVEKFGKKSEPLCENSLIDFRKIIEKENVI